MVECFHAITIGTKHLHFRCEKYCIIFPSTNKSFPRNPFEFLHIRESLVSRSSRLETRSSNVSSIEARGSSFECQLTFERYCKQMHIPWRQLGFPLCLAIVLSPGGTPIYGLYRYVPRNRVWFLRFSVLK